MVVGGALLAYHQIDTTIDVDSARLIDQGLLSAPRSDLVKAILLLQQGWAKSPCVYLAAHSRRPRSTSFLARCVLTPSQSGQMDGIVSSDPRRFAVERPDSLGGGTRGCIASAY